MIYRLDLSVTDYQEIPRGNVISVAPSRDGRSDVIDLWYEASSISTWLDHHTQGLYIFGTGHPTPWDHWTRYAWGFIGTVVTPSGPVWHVYTGPKKGEPVPG